MAKPSIKFARREKLSPEVIAVVEKWEEAMNASLSYMETHNPPATGFSADANVIAELPMMSAIAMMVPMIHGSDHGRLLKKTWLKRISDRLTESLAGYAQQLQAEADQKGKPLS